MMFYFASEMFDVKGPAQVVLGIILFVYASNSLGCAEFTGYGIIGG
jgi:hypothetical protein